MIDFVVSDHSPCTPGAQEADRRRFSRRVGRHRRPPVHAARGVERRQAPRLRPGGRGALDRARHRRLRRAGQQGASREGGDADFVIWTTPSCSTFAGAGPSPPQTHAVPGPADARRRRGDLPPGTPRLRSGPPGRGRARALAAEKERIMDFTQLIDLAAERPGGRALDANDEFFAPKENLLKAPRRRVHRGQVHRRASGWTAGKRAAAARPATTGASSGSACAASIAGVVVDTSFFTRQLPVARERSRRATATGAVGRRRCPRSELKGERRQPRSRSPSDEPLHAPAAQHLPRRRRRAPARVRRRRAGLVDDSRRRPWSISPPSRTAACRCSSSDMFSRHPQNLIMPGRAKNMGDGWETKRRRGPGHDWADPAPRRGRHLAPDRGRHQPLQGQLSRLLHDRRASICRGPRRSGSPTSSRSGSACCRRRSSAPNTRHFFEEQLVPRGPITHVRFNIYPDGGVSRAPGCYGQERDARRS